MTQTPETVMLHATTVAVDGRAVLIKGASGSGKSALALQLIAFGAVLVADDQTVLVRQDSHITAAPPASTAGLIEGRGVGIIELPYLSEVPVILIIDMDVKENDRLPEVHMQRLLDLALPCLHKVEAPHFPAAVMAYLMGSRKEPDAPNAR